MRIKLGCLVVISSLMLFACSDKKKLLGDRSEIIIATNDINVTGFSNALNLGQVSNLDEWNQFGSNSSNNTGVLSFSSSPRKQWEYSFDLSAINGNCMTAAPIFVKGNILFVDAGGILHSINAKTHRENWHFSTTVKNESGQIGTALACSNDIILVSTSFSECMGISLSGKLLWRRPLPAPCKGDAIAVSGNYAYLICGNNSLHKINVKNGEMLWSSKAIDSTNNFLGMAAPVLYNGYVIALYSSGEVSCVRENDGVEVWENIVSKYNLTDVSTAIQHLRVSPLVDKGIVYVVASNGIIESFDIKTGSRVWTKDIGGLSQIASAESHLFVVDRNANLACIDKLNGSIAWIRSLATKEKVSLWNLGNITKGFNRKINTYYPWYGQLLTSSGIIITTQSGKLLYINPKTGSIKKEIEIGHPISIPPIIVNEVMYILCDDGYLLAYK